MTSPPPIVWRIAAALLWIVSIACLFQAVNRGVTAEQALHNPKLAAADQRELEIADHWAVAGWVLQFATAAVLSFGLNSPRVVRRIFVSLGVLIAADGMLMLLFAIIVR